MLTAIVLAKNEETNIKKCLESLMFANETIVVDDQSTDKTVKIAKEMGVAVYSHALKNNFAGQRNFALSKAKNDWVLFVDADERVTPELSNEIKTAIKGCDYHGYYLLRRDTFCGKEMRHGESGTMRLLRLARKDRGKWQRAVHETWAVHGKVGELCSPLLHYPHPTIASFLKKINMYSSLHASVLYRERVQSNAAQFIIYPIGKFLVNYFVRLGFLDGMPGLIMALMMSFHSFLARGKLYAMHKEGPPEYAHDG